MSQKRKRGGLKLEDSEGGSSTKQISKRKRVDDEGEEDATKLKSKSNASSKSAKSSKEPTAKAKNAAGKGKLRTKEVEPSPEEESIIDIAMDEDDEEEVEGTEDEDEEYAVEVVPPRVRTEGQIKLPRERTESSDEEEYEDYNELDDEEDGEDTGRTKTVRTDLDIDALMATAVSHAQSGEDTGQKRSYKREFNIPCAYCEVMLKDYGYLFRHVSRLHKLEPDVDEYLNEIRPRMRASCPICNKSVSSASNVSAHIKQCHAGEECSVKCPLCSKIYKTQISLKQHLRQCHQPQVRKFKCSHCDMKFTEGRSLKEHINCTHETTQIFRCDDCGKTFLTKGRLRRHKYIHSEFRHYCTYCNKGFHLKDNMNKHIEIMHEKKFGKRFQCPHCPKNFAVKGNMKQHIMGVHLRQYAYSCPICGEGYRRKKDMLLHMEQHKEGMSSLKIEDVRIDPHTIKLPPPSVKVQMAPSDGLTTGTTVIEVLPQNIKVLTE